MAIELSVTAAAKIIGVSRARVYQRITGDAGTWDAGRPLEAVARPSNKRGHRNGKMFQIALEVVLEWRAERLAAGLDVGPVPPQYQSHEPIPKPPTIPPIVGMPNLSPF